MAYDIPSISDLEAIQLLNKHYAEVITSKEGGVSSSADITQTTNPITGVVRRTLYKILDDMDETFLERLLKMAFTPVGTFTDGATLTDARQTLLWEVSEGGDGHYYSWAGSFGTSGKVVTAGSSPSPIAAGSWVDRTDDSLRDEIRETVFQNMKRLAAEAGFNLVDGSFEEGANISGWPDVVWCQADGKYYQWYLDAAKTVAAGSTPATSGGIGATAWVDRTDASSGVEERLLGVGAKIYRGSNEQYVQNGDVVPAGTTHLRVLVGGETVIIAMSPIASGTVSFLTETNATIGGSNVYFAPWISNEIKEYTDIVYKASGGNSAVENMVAGSPVAAVVGGVCSTGGTLWKRVAVTNPTVISDFEPITEVFVDDFGSDGVSLISTMSMYDSVTINKEFSITANGELPEGKTLKFGSNGLLNIASAISLDINCILDAPETQVIIAGDGDYTLLSNFGETRTISAINVGIVPGISSRDHNSTRFLKLCAAIPKFSEVVVEWLGATFGFGTATITTPRGMINKGADWRATNLNYKSGSTDFIRLGDSNTFKDIQLTSSEIYGDPIPTGGTALVVKQGSNYPQLNNVWIDKAYNGLVINDHIDADVDNVRVFNAVGVDVQVSGTGYKLRKIRCKKLRVFKTSDGEITSSSCDDSLAPLIVSSVNGAIDGLKVDISTNSGSTALSKSVQVFSTTNDINDLDLKVSAKNTEIVVDAFNSLGGKLKNSSIDITCKDGVKKSFKTGGSNNCENITIVSKGDTTSNSDYYGEVVANNADVKIVGSGAGIGIRALNSDQLTIYTNTFTVASGNKVVNQSSTNVVEV